MKATCDLMRETVTKAHKYKPRTLQNKVQNKTVYIYKFILNDITDKPTSCAIP